MSESSLILRLRKGESKALEEVYARFRSSFLSWITHTHKCTKEEALDIYQYTILSFYENVVEGSFENMNDAGIKTYLYSIGKNKLLNDSRRKMKVTYTDVIEENEEPAEIDLDVDFIKSQKIEKINKALSEIGDPCKELLELFYFNNLTADEIAEVMNYKNGGTVRNLK
jgi:RNA polymerase sigma-70 factor (ECF subfamily)